MYDKLSRRNLKRIKQKQSYLEMLGEFIKLFFDMSTIHGCPHISQDGRHLVERIFWIVIVAAAVYCTVILSSVTLTRYRENPIVISMERDRFSWNTSFPPATICTDTKYDMNMLEDYVTKNDSIKDKTLFKTFIISLTQATYLNFETVVEYKGISGEEFVNLIYKFQLPFKPTVSNMIDTERYTTFQETFTEMGICYSFNSQLALYNSAEYWTNGTWKLLPEKETFFINPFDGDVFVSAINISDGYQLYFHGPYETVDIASKHMHHINSDKKNYQILLSGLSIFAAERTKGLSPKQRNCRFHYESNLPHFPVYSYVLCRMECRATLAKKLCGCLPHFYRKLDGEKICDVQGLHCLAKYKERLIFLRKQCSCISNCDETVYVIEDYKVSDYPLGSFLLWALKECPKMRLKRDLIFGFSDVLVYIGGLAGLFLGSSVLSFIEIIYFFTLRLFWFFVKKRRQEMLASTINL